MDAERDPFVVLQLATIEKLGLQQARQRRALRGLGTAETPLRGGTGGLEIAAQIVAANQYFK